MSKPFSSILQATAGLSLALGGMSVAPPVAHAQTVAAGGDADVAFETPSQSKGSVSKVQLDRVFGSFSYGQESLDSNETIAKVIGRASAVLCGANEANDFSKAASEGAWDIEIGGDVQESFVLSEMELSENDYELRAMKCACAGNPVDGKSAVNAHVAGVPLTEIIQRAQPNEGVNTIVFTSADGYEVALPIKYVTQRVSMLVFKINGECLDESVGGNNQLWLGMTSARYFARDIVKVDLQARDTPPPTPGTEAARDTYANNPNIGVKSGGAGV